VQRRAYRRRAKLKAERGTPSENQRCADSRTNSTKTRTCVRYNNGRIHTIRREKETNSFPTPIEFGNKKRPVGGTLRKPHAEGKSKCEQGKRGLFSPALRPELAPAPPAPPATSSWHFPPPFSLRGPSERPPPWPSSPRTPSSLSRTVSGRPNGASPAPPPPGGGGGPPAASAAQCASGAAARPGPESPAEKEGGWLAERGLKQVETSKDTRVIAATLPCGPSHPASDTLMTWLPFNVKRQPISSSQRDKPGHIRTFGKPLKGFDISSTNAQTDCPTQSPRIDHTKGEGHIVGLCHGAQDAMYSIGPGEGP
jgi:hypothetical protein